MSFGVSGVITYDDVQQVIDAVVYTESRKYAPLLPGMEIEDVEQEIRYECLKAMGSYDPDRIGPYPYRFFQVCVKNHFYNMRRGIYVPNNPPCYRCHLWDKSRKICLIDEVGCDKIVDHRKNMERKAALKRPATLEGETTGTYSDRDLGNFILDESIKDILPDELRMDYELMKSGKADEVSPRNKAAIRNIVRRVISDE
jgi:hypothetical protein